MACGKAELGSPTGELSYVTPVHLYLSDLVALFME